jgi:hypothetical protein
LAVELLQQRFIARARGKQLIANQSESNPCTVLENELNTDDRESRPVAKSRSAHALIQVKASEVKCGNDE